MSNNGLDQRSIAKWEAEQADPNHNPIPENNGRAEMGGSHSVSDLRLLLSVCNRLAF